MQIFQRIYRKERECVSNQLRNALFHKLLPGHAGAHVIPRLQHSGAKAQAAAERVEHAHLQPCVLGSFNAHQVVCAGKAGGKVHGRNLLVAQRGNFVQYGAYTAAAWQGCAGHFTQLLAPVDILRKNTFAVQKLAVCAAHMQRNHKNRLVFAQLGGKICARVCQKGDFFRVVGKTRRLG